MMLDFLKVCRQDSGPAGRTQQSWSRGRRHAGPIILLRFAILLLLLNGNSLLAQQSVNQNAIIDSIRARLEGPNVTISNFTFTQLENTNQYGTFDGGNVVFGNGPTIGIGKGVILSTGTVNQALGPNNSTRSTVDYSATFNDPDLTSIESLATRDVIILEFDIVPQNDNIQVDYVFSSEEYDEYVCSNFNDAFGFFLSGPGIAGGKGYINDAVNLAELADGDPVSVNSINNGSVGSNGSAGNCIDLTNTALYVNNDNGDHTQWDAFTIVMQSAFTLTPGNTYHVKLALADAGDGAWDAAVYLRFFGSPGTTDQPAVYTAIPPTLVHTLSNGDTAASVVDPNGPVDQAVLSSGSLPAGMSLNPVNGAITVTDATLLVAGTYNFTITTTDYNGGVTSNIPVTITLLPSFTISGTVFEDVNYGGGSGRAYSTANTSATGSGFTSGSIRIEDVKIELYDNAGNFQDSTSTDANGQFQFIQLPAGDYSLRAVNGTVSSSRGSNATGQTIIPVQTFRTTASSGSAVAVTNEIGGSSPNGVDAAVNTTNATLGSITAQSVTPVTLSSADISGLDFGFNFNTIVNENDGNQGSLRQFILNSNELPNSNLDQESNSSFDPAAGTETSIFMIPAGQLDLRGVAEISPASALPAISDDATSIDGRTQTANIGDNNSGALGDQSTIIGVGGSALSGVNAPEIEFTGGSVSGNGLSLSGSSNSVIRGIAIYGFGSSTSTANILVSGGSGNLISESLIGTAANSFSDPGAVTRSGGAGIELAGGTSGITISNNLIGFNGMPGIADNGSSAHSGGSISGNEIRGNGLANSANIQAGIELAGNASGMTISGNLLIANSAQGIDLDGATNVNISSNTVSGNGIAAVSNADRQGILLTGSSSITVSQNIIQGNTSDGLMVASDAATVAISQNSFYNNGALPIELGAYGSATGSVTPNNGSQGSGANNGMDYPVFTLAALDIAANTLQLDGYIGSAANQSTFANATIELYIANDDGNQNGEVVSGDGESQAHGEGRTFKTSFTSDASGNFSTSLNPTTLGISIGDTLTATATLAGHTSEFSANIIVSTAVSIRGIVYSDANHNSLFDGNENGTGLTLYAKLIDAATPGGPASEVVAVNTTSGAYLFSDITSGTYNVVIDDNNSSADVTPASITGWISTEAPGLIRQNISTGSSDVFNQNFGLFNGSVVRGKVFNDNGTNSGTPNDGLQNGSEIGIPSVTVQATNSAGSTVYDEDLTDGSGDYTLWIPASAGNNPVKIVEANLAGYLSTGGAIGNSAGSYDRPADEISFTNSIGSSYSGLNFADVPENSFSPDNQQASSPGTVLYYGHSFTAGSGGTLTFSSSRVSTPAISGWNSLIYVDSNCNGQLDNGESLFSGSQVVTEGQVVCIVVKVTVPSTAPEGATDLLTISADFDYDNASPSLDASRTVTDLTTINNFAAGLELNKVADRSVAAPGDVIVYTITYFNNSGETLTNIEVSDATPGYTTFVSAGFGALPNSITGITVASPSAGNSGGITWTFSGSLVSGASGTLTFSIQVD